MSSFISTVSPYGANLTALGNLWRAARWSKNVPLAFLIVAGVLLPASSPNFLVLGVSLITLLMASAFFGYIVMTAVFRMYDSENLWFQVTVYLS